MNFERIYLDNAATTPLRQEVADAMHAALEESGFNPSSLHAEGRKARAVLDEARDRIAATLGATRTEITFTASGTEANNLALFGMTRASAKGRHIVVSAIEHPAVLRPAAQLRDEGFEVTYLPVASDGQVAADAFEAALRPGTVLASIMYANNEIGTIHPIREIGKIAKQREIVFHCDAVQAVGTIPVDVEKDGIDLLSMSGHKIYGPKGVGALYVRSKGPRVRLTPIIDGGGHERGMRSGTLNVTGIVGFGAACEIAKTELAGEARYLTDLRNQLQAQLFERLDEVYLNGHPTERLPGNLNVSFAYVEGESLLMGINDVAVSSGSACTSATLEPSYVIRALGTDEELAHSSIRFGLGRFNTGEEVDYVAERVTREVKRLREMSPLYEMAREGIDLKSVQWKA